MRRAACRAALATWLAAVASLGSAHDSWLAAPATAGARPSLALSTGERYPLASSAPPATSLAQAACIDGMGRRQPLRARKPGAAALPLVLHPSTTGPHGCWVELHEYEVTLTPQLVDTYFREVRPTEAVREAWSAQRASGEPWIERYRKFARIERSGATDAPSALHAIRKPQGLDLELVVVGDAPLRAGEPAGFRLLSRNEPVAGLAIELVSERSAVGVWSRTAADGSLGYVLPFAGKWLLRGTWLEPDGPPGHWRSRFVTLAFEAAP
jgi:hypothetical protein